MSPYDLPPMSWAEVLGALGASLIIFYLTLRASRKAERRRAQTLAAPPLPKKGAVHGRSSLDQ